MRIASIEVVAIGDSAPSTLRALVTSIPVAVGLRVRIDPQPLSEVEALDPQRLQLDSRDLLRRLELRARPGALVVGVAARDLYSTVFRYVFGEAVLHGAVAVVSSYRLRVDPLGGLVDPMIVQQRLSKECLHEIGHLFGLVHCADPGCVMRFSASVAEIDSKSMDYCDPCLERLVEARSRNEEA